MPDLAGRSLGLLALNPHQRGLLFLIREIDVERAVGDQREADYSDEQRNVLDEQPAAHDRGAGRRRDAAPGGPPAPKFVRRDDQAALSCNRPLVFAPC